MRYGNAALLSFMLLACIAPAATGAVIHFMEFQQLVYEVEEEAGPGLPDEVGSLLVVYDKDPDVGFLNLAAVIPGLTPDPVWLVRNLPLYSIEMGPPMAEMHVRIPLSWLGVEYGMLAPSIQFGWAVMTSPMVEADGEAWAQTVPLLQNQPVMLQTVDARGLKPELSEIEYTWADPDGRWHEPFSPVEPAIVTYSTIGCAMPNIPLNENTNPMDGAGCVAASTTNSMLWLKGKHPEIDFPGDQRKVFEQFSHLMNRKPGEGVTTEEQARAKLDFIEAHNLPIKVKIQNKFSDGNVKSSSGHTSAADTDGGPEGTWPSLSWIQSETQDEEDVEINYGYWYKDAAGKWRRYGGHSVVLTGAGTILGSPYLDIKHDANQEDDTGTKEETFWLTSAPNGAIEISGEGGTWKHKDGIAYKHHAFIDGVVSESLDTGATPPPSSETFGGYCEEFVRVIPPGKTLEIDFPSSTWWCRNVTVYTRDRSDDPAVDRKFTEWNKNEGKTRKIANTDTTKTLTVVVHNDDSQPYRPGYSPWTVDLRVVNNSTRETTPGNPDEYGGFSMGWADSSSAEFRHHTAPTLTVAADIGADLSLMPAWLGMTTGCQELILTRQIPVWNHYWQELGFIVDVVGVGQPGDLFVECPATGTAEMIPIAAPGRYEIYLGLMAPAPDFLIRLVPSNGLEMELDSVGVPCMVDDAADVGDDAELPRRPVIRTVHPNPFNPQATIRFALPRPLDVELAVFDLQGRRVATVFEGRLGGGSHTQVWRGRTDDGRDAAAGTYLVRLRADGQTITAKATLIK